MAITPETGAFLSRSPRDAVAVFDSGVGGLTVLWALQKALPHERFLYWGDTANAPYGERGEAEIRALTQAAADHLLRARRCKALVLACNTATAAAAKTLRADFPDVPVIGMEPAVRPALAATSGVVWVLGTTATLRSDRFRALIPPRERERVVPLPAPGMVPLIETGKADGDEMEQYLRQLTRVVPPPAAVVLGCTHFPLARASLTRVFGDVPFFDGAAGTAAQTARVLRQQNLLNPAPSRGFVTLTATSPAGRARLYSLYYAH